MNYVEGLTVCTVFHNEQSREFLRRNWEFAKKINTNPHWRWIAVNNSPNPNREGENALGFRVVDGVARQMVLDKYPAKLHKKPIINSYHHAEALNKMHTHTDTRFVLLLDSDYYIVRREWVHDVIAHMQNNNLAIFGSPWHPYHSNDYRYFPNQQCFFIDRDQVDMEKLDWRPVYESFADQPIWLRYAGILPVYMKKRLQVNTSKDTSHLVYAALHRVVKFDTAIPVVRQLAPRSVGGRIWRTIEQVLIPDRLQLIPRRKGSYSLQGFKDFGYFDIDGYDGEEFMWQGRPFGFHVRRFKFARRLIGKVIEEEQQFAILEKALKSFAGRTLSRVKKKSFS